MDGRNTRERIPTEKNEAIFLMVFKYLPFATSNSIVKDKQEIFFEISGNDVTISVIFIKLTMNMKRLSSMEETMKIILMLTQSIFHGGARNFLLTSCLI